MPVTQLSLPKGNLVSHCQTKVLLPHTLHICLVVWSITLCHVHIDVSSWMYTNARITYLSPFSWRTFGWTALWTLVWTAWWTVVGTALCNFIIPPSVHLKAIDICLLFHQLPFLIFEFIQTLSKISMYSVWAKPQWIHLSSFPLLLVGILQEYFCFLRKHLCLVFSVICFLLALLCSFNVGFDLLECFLPCSYRRICIFWSRSSSSSSWSSEDGNTSLSIGRRICWWKRRKYGECLVDAWRDAL